MKFVPRSRVGRCIVLFRSEWRRPDRDFELMHGYRAFLSETPVPIR
jgi:hypothetical protein